MIMIKLKIRHKIILIDNKKKQNPNPKVTLKKVRLESISLTKIL